MNEKEQNLTKQLSLKQNWFTRATLGAAMADSPAVMTASGWRRNDNGDYVQDKFDDPATNRLANNLGVISSIAQTGPSLIDDAVGIYKMIANPKQTAKQFSNLVSDVYNRLKRLNWQKVYHGSKNNFTWDTAIPYSRNNIGLHISP